MRKFFLKWVVIPWVEIFNPYASFVLRFVSKELLEDKTGSEREIAERRQHAFDMCDTAAMNDYYRKHYKGAGIIVRPTSWCVWNPK